MLFKGAPKTLLPVEFWFWAKSIELKSKSVKVLNILIVIFGIFKLSGLK
jgi:hypothetical protein